MNQITRVGKGVAATLGVAAAGRAGKGVAAVRRRAVFGSRPRRAGSRQRHVVTVLVPEGQLAAGSSALEPLTALGDAVEVSVRPAPGDRGSELSARIVHPLGSRAGDAADDDAAVRGALRRAKALAEIGFVPSPDRPTTTEATPLNAPLREATAHGREGGRL
jgi:hypothetical protein